MQKLVKHGEACYLALILPKKAVVAAQQGSPDLEYQGMTQKVKRALMKEREAIRKPPPMKDTQRKIYREVPREVRDGLDKILSDFEDMFPEQLPKGQPPKREVEFAIKTEPNVAPPNRPPYRLSSKEHEELQARLRTCSLKDISARLKARTVHRSYSFQRRTVSSACASTTGL